MRANRKKRLPMTFRRSYEEKNVYIPLQSTNFGHVQTLGNEEHRFALDSALPSSFYGMASTCDTGISNFLGYAILQQLSQNALISAGVETLADEMTRRFVKLENNGEEQKNEDVSKKIEELNADIRTFEVRTVFRKAAEHIGYYGGCLVYIDNGTDDRYLNTPLILDPASFKQGSLKNFVVIDPINCYPGFYNSSNPLSVDYFVPNTWMVLGKEVHRSRLFYFCGKEAPLLLKPTYNFFGVPIAQMAWDFVQHFTDTREATSRLLTKFSLVAFKTNLMGAMSGSGTKEVNERIRYFIEKQNNDGCFVIDKDTEDLMKLDTTLSGTTEIVRQALELLATVFRIPAVKFLGISPSGFNATGESDIRNFYDYCASTQEKQLGSNFQKVLEILQINRYGIIDKSLTFSFVPLGDEDEKLQADIQKTKADTVAVYLDRNVISGEEAREVLAQDPKSGFNGLDLENFEPETYEPDTDKANALW